MTQSKGLERVRAVAGEGRPKRLRPSECRSHMRRVLAQEFQGIVDGFVAAAKKGSCPHVKLATELLKPVRKSPSRKKGTATQYYEKIAREWPEKSRLEEEALKAKAK
jgi:hypothetical protein